MKKSDIAMLILIASISMMVAFFVAKAILGDVYNGSETVKTIEKISSDITQPSSDIFYKGAINPSVKVQIVGNQ